MGFSANFRKNINQLLLIIKYQKFNFYNAKVNFKILLSPLKSF